MLVSQYNTKDRTPTLGVLIVAEPYMNEPEQVATLAEMLDTAPVSLVVLPKRDATPDMSARWVRGTSLKPTEEVAQVLTDIGGDCLLYTSPSPRD